MTFVIAEAGVNHNGDMNTARMLIDAAKGAGADAVKFQLFKSRKLWGDDRIAHLELSFDQMAALASHCRVAGIEFMCTPFGVEELAFLKPLLKRVKIASGCLRREPLLEYAADTGLPVILSTGMATTEEIEGALMTMRGEVALLHCTSAYPCALEDVNLRAMEVLFRYGKPVGYSDHTAGILVAPVAVALGASIIEKHLTLDRYAEGPDHRASVEPSEFARMVQAIRGVEAALGDGVKRPRECEADLRRLWRHD